LQRTLGRLIHGREWKTYRVPEVVAKIGAWALNSLSFGPEPFIKPWMIDRADDHYELDVTRARTLLGWEPRRSLRGALPVMVEALKRDPVAWYEANKLDPPGWLTRPARGVRVGYEH
jgi:nucleoside-diphosphate-sugar epimerase